MSHDPPDTFVDDLHALLRCAHADLEICRRQLVTANAEAEYWRGRAVSAEAERNVAIATAKTAAAKLLDSRNLPGLPAGAAETWTDDEIVAFIAWNAGSGIPRWTSREEIAPAWIRGAAPYLRGELGRYGAGNQLVGEGSCHEAAIVAANYLRRLWLQGLE